MGICNAPREHKIDGRIEVARVFQKKRPLFRKEDFETLVDCGLRFIRFDLGEIRIDRGVKYQPVLENDFGIETGAGLKAFSEKVRITTGAIVESAERAQRTVGNKLNIPAWRNITHPVNLGFLRKEALRVTGNARIKRKFVVAPDIPFEKDPPSLLRSTRKAQRTKRNLKPEHITLRIDAAL